MKNLYRQINYKDRNFELSESFSEPIWSYFYNLKSLIKYHDLTKNLVTSEISTNEFYKDTSWTETPEEDFFDLSEAPLVIDGDEWEHEREFIPEMQKNLLICMSLALVEKLLDQACKEIDPDRLVGSKGSYIQERVSFLKKMNAFSANKETMKVLTIFGQIRNSFIHQLNTNIPEVSVAAINELTGPFSDIASGISNIHVELLLSYLVSFGDEFQNSYLNSGKKPV